MPFFTRNDDLKRAVSGRECLPVVAVGQEDHSVGEGWIGLGQGEGANSRLVDHLGIEDAQPPRLASLRLEGLNIGGGSLGSTGLRRGFDTHKLASD